MTKKGAQEHKGLEMHDVWSHAIERHAREVGSECAGTVGMPQIRAGIARGDVASVKELAGRVEAADQDGWQLLQGHVAWMRNCDAAQLLPLFDEAGCRPPATFIDRACAGLLSELRKEARPYKFAREVGESLKQSGEDFVFLHGGVLRAALTFSQAWTPLIGRTSTRRLTPWLQQALRRDLEKHGRLRWQSTLLLPEVTWLLGEVARHAGGTANSETSRLAAFVTPEMTDIARQTAADMGIISAPKPGPRRHF